MRSILGQERKSVLKFGYQIKIYFKDYVVQTIFEFWL